MVIGEGVHKVYDEILTPAGMVMWQFLQKWEDL